MSSLVLVRHAQATFLEDDYDRLSPLGESQSRLLGSFWRDRQLILDQVFTGPRLRQIRTAALVGEVYLEAGLAWPKPQIVRELDEYDADAIMTAILPRLLPHDPRLPELADALERSPAGPEKHKSFQRLFEAVMGAWARGDANHFGIEPWTEYRDRVRRGILQLTAGAARGRRVAAFTSGGPISAAIQMALDIADQKVLELNWQVRNCSLTEFLFSGDRFSLVSFNGLPHLADVALWSYR